MTTPQPGGITIVGLGPGDGRLLTRQAWAVLSAAPVVYLRTERHPAVADLPAHVQRSSFDALYEAAGDFAEVYERITQEILRLGRTESGVIYAVPGHPFVGEATVAAVVQQAQTEGLPVTIVPGLSFVEPTLSALQRDGLDGLQLFDAIEVGRYHFPPISPDWPLLLGQLYSRPLASEVKLSLLAAYPEEHRVALVRAAGTANEVVQWMPLYELDRTDQVDHLTSLFVPPLAGASTLEALAETVAILRAPGGCPWDQEQTSQSLRPGFLEEASEVLDAIDTDDPAALREELGDLLYHVVMQIQIAAEAGDFRLADVMAGIDAKIRRRHPHVWGDWQVSTSAEVLRNWEILKEREKEPDAEIQNSLVDNIPSSLPALARAQKIQERVRKVGFDWPDVSGVVAKVDEEIAELRRATSPQERAAEVGDLLFALVNWARWLGVDAETALRESNLRFSRRFRQVERLAAARGLDMAQMDLPALDHLWDEVKRTWEVSA